MDFDNTKSFDDNLETFIQHMETSDAEMGKVLRDNIDSLKGATDDSSRRRARADFNSKVITALKQIRMEQEDA